MIDFDIKISKYIQDRFRSSLEFWWLMAGWGLYIYGFVVVALVFVIDDKHRVIIWLLPVFTTFFITIILQYLIRRKRPEITKTTYKLLVNTFSFPSAHASTSMAFATSLAFVFIRSHLEYGWVFAFIFFILAFFIAMSRIVVGVHYFGDVIIGILFGYSLPFLFFLLGFF